MSRKSRRQGEYLQELMRNETYNLIFDRIMNLCIDRFEWSGLPENIEQRHVEEALFRNGRAVFFEDSMLGLLCLPCHTGQRMNVYGEPLTVRATGYGYNEEVSVDDGVVIKNNYNGTGNIVMAQVYSERIKQIEVALNTNVIGQTTPFIIACNEKDRVTMQNIYTQRVDGEPIIYADKSLNLDALQVHLTPSAFVCDKLADYKHDVWNEVLTILGINNANTDKRERLVTEEVNANNEQIDFNIQFMLECRKQACEQINEMFGLNVSVELKGGEQESGEVYDGVKRDSQDN